MICQAFVRLVDRDIRAASDKGKSQDALFFAILPPWTRRKARYPMAMPKMRKKSDLPSKTCVACGRPFVWRKAWARDWDRVLYCSDGCRKQRPTAGRGTGGTVAR